MTEGILDKLAEKILPKPHRLNEVEECYTMREVANAWDISVKTVSREIARGNLGVFRVGRSIRIPRSELLRWVSTKMKTAQQIYDKAKALASPQTGSTSATQGNQTPESDDWT